MNYLQEITARIQIGLSRYKTPQSVIDKLNKGEQRQYKPQVYTSNRKVILGNPPYNGKAKKMKG